MASLSKRSSEALQAWLWAHSLQQHEAFLINTENVNGI
jgi:hypothetical protein